MRKKDIYSWVALFLLTVGEVLTACGGVYQILPKWEWFVGFIGLMLLVLIIIGRHKHVIRLNTYTFTNLLANAIVPRLISVLFLFDFVMHLSWMTDGFLNIMVGDPWAYPLSIGSIGLFVLFVTFPETIATSGKVNCVTFVSGISKITPQATTVTYTDGSTEKLNVISCYNQVPLVRILNLVLVKESQEISSNDICKLLILKTDAHKLEQFRKPAVDITEYQERLSNDTMRRIFGNRLKNATTQDHKSLSLVVLDEQAKNLDDVLKEIIRTTALLEFSDETPFIQRLKIEFTEESCDYDNFEDCFRTLDKAIRKEDDKNHALYFNLTPGTGIIGSLMTLFSIDSDRKLFFYSQFSEIDKNKRIKPVDKMKLPLENLLSQALEKMKGNH